MLSPLSLLFGNKKTNSLPKEKAGDEAKKVATPKEKLEKKVEKSNDKKIKTETKSEETIKQTNMITTDQVKALRNQTGVSVMQCKKALEEAGGDTEKALVILRKKSGELAAKKTDRTFNAGTVQAYIHSNGSVGAIVELNCETDFVSNNEEFKNMARDIAMHITATNPKFVSMNDITEADKATAKEVFENEVKGKPESVRQSILDGKLNAYFGEMVLLNQPFIKNPDITIGALLDQAVQKFGEKTAISRFKRFKILES